MGLFDGVAAPARAARAPTPTSPPATAGRWCWCSTSPGTAQSAAAVALGCALYDPRVTIAGVILNKVASARHRRLVEAGWQRVGIPVLGALMRDATLVLPERHLGLVQAGETADLDGAPRPPRRPRRERASTSTRSWPPAPAARRPVGAGAAPAPARPAHRGRPRRGVQLPLPAPGGRLAARAGPRSSPFSPLADEAPAGRMRRLLAARRLSGAACRRASPRATHFLDGLRAFARDAGRSTASAAATWCWARAWRTPTASRIHGGSAAGRDLVHGRASSISATASPA